MRSTPNCEIPISQTEPLAGCPDSLLDPGWTGSDIIFAPCLSEGALRVRFALLNSLSLSFVLGVGGKSWSDFVGYEDVAAREYRDYQTLIRDIFGAADRKHSLTVSTGIFYCPECWRRLYHTQWFDTSFFENCPIHSVQLEFAGTTWKEAAPRMISKIMPVKQGVDLLRRKKVGRVLAAPIASTSELLTVYLRMIDLEPNAQYADVFLPLSEWARSGMRACLVPNPSFSNASALNGDIVGGEGAAEASSKAEADAPEMRLLPSTQGLVFVEESLNGGLLSAVGDLQSIASSAIAMITQDLAEAEAGSTATILYAALSRRAIQRMEHAVHSAFVEPARPQARWSQLTVLYNAFKNVPLAEATWTALFGAIYCGFLYQVTLEAFGEPNERSGEWGVLFPSRIFAVSRNGQLLGLLIPKPFFDRSEALENHVPSWVANVEIGVEPWSRFFLSMRDDALKWIPSESFCAVLWTLTKSDLRSTRMEARYCEELSEMRESMLEVVDKDFDKKWGGIVSHVGRKLSRKSTCLNRTFNRICIGGNSN